MQYMTVMIIFTIVALWGSGCATPGDSNVTAEETLKMIESDSDIVLLDVRTPGEFEGELGHLEGALLIPVQELEKRSDELAPYKDRTIVAYCRTGRRSLTATDLLKEKGYRVLNLEGGMVGWNKQELPHVVRGK